ncbi:PEP-CTERM sorting domain-containing protein [Ferrovum myxofaciens]|uniref:PEP-CTERM sorting domain-containing protein n=1 Tax=Ferrovum myxofaciens TaxID=416213 RepID=UPI002354667B|nr:PEP-CTERM sorting domain-containing protein [Ferrovum myxofaciens]MBU6995412.1 PEP-CTERM sorting domain-containing protein [Ferrovum myxofaciens]
MKLQKISLLASLAAAVVLVGMSSNASAGLDITNWQLNLNSLSTQPGYGGVAGLVNSGISNLAFNGESYVTNTAITGQPGMYKSTDVGVFNVLQYNNGNVLKLGGGQLTAYFQGTDITNVNTGSYTFQAGTFSVYYNPTAVYGTTFANNYGATIGTKIASFKIYPTQNPNTSGGFINPDGTPTSNGTVTLTGQAPTTLTPGNIFLDSNGSSFNQNILLSFVTANASLDTSANPNTPSSPSQYAIDQNLVTGLGVAAGTYNGQYGLNYFIQNGGQFKLQYAPEPMTVALFGAGLLAIGWSLRRRSNV